MPSIPTISAHLQTQRANTSFIGKSRATCRKKNNNCWSDSSDHDLGRDIENASIPQKYGSIEWGEKTEFKNLLLHVTV